MDWIEHVMSAVVGACFGVGMVLTWRRIKAPKPVNRDEIPNLRAQAIEGIEQRFAANSGAHDDLFRDVEFSFVEKEKRVQYLRLYAKFTGTHEINDIDGAVGTLQRVAGKPKKGYTEYGTKVELTDEHIDLYRDLKSALKDASDFPQTKQELNELWERHAAITQYAFSQSNADSYKVLDIIRDRSISDLDSIKELLNDMGTPGSGAISSGAL